jgi:hypothetical protein
VTSSPVLSPSPTSEAPTRGELRALLERACDRQGTPLLGHRLRSVHRRGRRSSSHVYEARVWDGRRIREVLLVVHVDRRWVPRAAHTLPWADGRVAVWRYPHDPYLPGLPAALEPARAQRLLDPEIAGRGAPRLRTRAYRPARRAVVEVRGSDGEPAPLLFLKVLSTRRAERLAATHRHLGHHVPVPAVVGTPRRGVLALEALAGRTLREALIAGTAVPDPGELVEISQRLATSGLVSERSPGAFADPGRHVALLCELAPRHEAVIRRVADAAGRVDGARVPVHGDLHAGQLLVGASGITGLLDVDGAGTGLMAQDAGTLVAYLRALGGHHPAAVDRLEAYADAVAGRYRPVVGRDALARATAGGWLALATGPFRAQEPRWPERTRLLVERAAESLGDA